jgi:hypothetical protein
MFYMPGTKMLFGDAKETCDGKSKIRNIPAVRRLTVSKFPAIKRVLEQQMKD